MKLTPEETKQLMDTFILDNQPVLQQEGDLSIEGFADAWGTEIQQTYKLIAKHCKDGKLEKVKGLLLNGKHGSFYRIIK
jgi:hypothetical protein